MNEEKREQTPILRVDDVRCHYPQKKKYVRSDGTVIRKAVVKAVDGVSFSIPKGEILGVIGESGCGKSSLGRLLVRLEKCTSGKIYLDGQDMENLYRKDRLAFRRLTELMNDGGDRAADSNAHKGSKCALVLHRRKTSNQSFSTLLREEPKPSCISQQA